MINKLTIKNFKIHKSLTLDLSNLTILAGQNSSGKSAILQALLLLRQSYIQGRIYESLQLQGDLCNIGLVDDAICEYADDDTIEFTLQTEEKTVQWQYAIPDNNGFKDMIPIVSPDRNMVDFEDAMRLFGKKFHYISAARKGPQESYPLNTATVEINNQLSTKLGECDLVAHYLHYYGVENNTVVNEALRFDDIESPYLIPQVSAWERLVSAGVNVNVQKEGKSFVMKYSYTKKGDFVASKEYSATNVGYGLSYALPIIVALLTAEPNSLLLIENPEIHLHPQGQSALAQLIARAAQMGAQIIIETHSDHIINGVLKATKLFENGKKGIDKNLTRIYQCKKDEETQLSLMEPIRIIGDGKIDRQPDDFFDQIDKDLEFLMGF